MSLRDDNPMIDSDLELIITSFEKAMVKSRDVDSVFVPFRRQLTSLSSYPKSVVSSIDSVPAALPVEESVASPSGSLPQTSSLELASGEATEPVEETTEEDNLAQKVKEWAADCAPCYGDFERTISAMDADFFADIGKEWDSALDEVWNRLKGFENLLEDVDITSEFCDIGDMLKFQCLPDIQKMIFVLSSLLSRMEIELSFSLNVLDSFLMSALAPIFNELAANLDLISDLAINPIKCALSYIEYQVNHSREVATQARSAIIDPVRQSAYEQRIRMVAARHVRSERRDAEGSFDPEDVVASAAERRRLEEAGEAERAAERQRLEQGHARRAQRAGEQYASALQRANQAFDRAHEATSFLDGLQEYLAAGTDYLEEKKEWLLSLIEEFINNYLDEWNDQMQFARSKTDILKFISILKAFAEAAQAGDISCGSGSDGLTEEDVARVVRYWQHPAESLEIIVEDGNITTRRRADISGESSDGGVITGGEGSDSVIENPPNIVVRRPISSCLKKVTTDEAERINHWIRQLEQEV